MASNEGERLLISFEARLNRYEKDIARARRGTDKNMTAMQARALSASTAIQTSFSNLGRGMLAGIAAGGAAGVAASLRGIASAVAEIGDQAKLAGVSSKIFQEWALVAQQARIPVDALADGLKELAIRGNEFAVTGKGSAAEAFARLGMSPAEVQERLKDPSAMLLELIDRLGKFDQASQIRLSDELFGGQAAERFGTLIDQGADSIRATIDEAHRLGNVMDDEMIAKAAEVDRQFTIVSQTVGSALKSAIVDAAMALQDFIDRFNGFEARRDASLAGDVTRLGRERLDVEREILELQEKQREGMGAGDGILGTSLGESTAGEAIQEAQRRMDAIAAEETMILDVLAARQKLNQATPGTAPAGFTPAPYMPPVAAGGAAKSKADRPNDFEREIAQAQQRIAALQIETGLRAGLNPLIQDYGASAEAASLKAQLLNEAQLAGVSITPDVTARINQLADAYGVAAAEAAKLGEEQDSARQSAEDLANLGGSLVSGFVSDLRAGKTASEALAGALNKIVDQLIDAAIQAMIVGPLLKMLGGGGGGWIGKLLGLSKGGPVPGYASGGKVSGPGTGKSDSILARLSAGEHVINAESARKHRPLLEAINDNRVPALSDGGAVGGTGLAARVAGGSSMTFAPQIAINVEAGAGGTPEDRSDLARQTAKQVEASLRGLVQREMQNAMRPGNFGNSRSR